MDLSYRIIGCAMEVYKNLGPGLLESVYEKAMIQELKNQEISVQNQVMLPIYYKGVKLCDDLRIDLLIENEIIIELKSVSELTTVHYKQLLTYLKLSEKKIGYLMNFNVADFCSGKGYKRMVNNY